ncbi:hypothetical protein TL16_g10959, partial [Triparma laevis f. inornata]
SPSQELDLGCAKSSARFYIDPASGYRVIPTHVHSKRGMCCGNRCRHCPFGWSNVPGLSDQKVEERLAVWRARVGGKEGEAPLAEKKKKIKRVHPPAVNCDLNTSVPITSVNCDLNTSVPIYSPNCDLNTSVPISSHNCDLDSQSIAEIKLANVPYTRGGDFGFTSITGLPGSGNQVRASSSGGPLRVSKGSDVVECLGATDEICSAVGVVYSHVEELIELDLEDNVLLKARKAELEDIIERLFDIGAILASGIDFGEVEGEKKKKSTASVDALRLPENTVSELEKNIDNMTLQLPELTNFILPIGGGLAASQCHLARSICRRAERDYVRYRAGVVGEGGSKEKDQVGKFLNRLSDYLFQLARQIMEERNRIYGSGEGELKFKKREDLGGRRGKAK